MNPINDMMVSSTRKAVFLCLQTGSQVCEEKLTASLVDRRKRAILLEGSMDISEKEQKYYKKNYKFNPWARTFDNIRSRKKHFKNYKNRKITITLNNLKSLWFRDKAWLLKRPSIDRKDNTKGYSFKNCRYIELAKNVQRANSKSTKQLTLDGYVIKTWDSLMDIQRNLGMCNQSISDVCNHKQKTAYGYKWEFAKKRKK